MSNFVDTLKDLLIENDLTRAELAKILNVKPPTITRYMLSKQYPTIEIAIKIGDYFNYTLDYLFGLKEVNEPKNFKVCPPFDKHFRFLLEYFNKSVKDINNETNLAMSAMFYWLSGKRTPTIDSIIKLAKFFNCSIDFVIGRVDFD